MPPERTNTVFFIGNKRSGTTHFVKVINRHRRVFVAPEADLVWSLFCHEAGQPIVRYPDDGDLGLRRTLASFESLITSDDKTPQEKFKLVLSEMARRVGKDPEELTWIGDKKPVQQADPQQFAFALKHWPNARFIHLVRHPQAVVNSMIRARDRLTWMDIWKQSPEALMDFWARNERRVLDHKQSGAAPILTVRFDDLTDDAARTWPQIAAFLGLEPDDVLRAAAEFTRSEQDRKYDEHQIPLTPQAAEIVKIYDL